MPNQRKTKSPAKKRSDVVAELTELFRDPNRVLTDEESSEIRSLFRAASEKKPKFIESIYDLYFLALLSDLSLMIEALKTYLSEWAEYLDFDRAQFEPTVRANRSLRKKVADMIVSVPFKKGERPDMKILIVVEHKAQSGGQADVETIANVVEYVVLTTTEQMRNAKAKNGEPRSRPQSLVVVFYTGPDPNYKAPEWSKAFPLPEPFAKFAFKIKIPRANVTRLYLDKKIKGTPLLRAGFSALACAGRNILTSAFASLVDIFREIKDADYDYRARRHFRNFLNILLGLFGESRTNVLERGVF
ncbi:MAG: Rpn family recombination-promoting nuclease/putative transposase [Thermoguttaceae bacterium]|nr:Rpn family recombination-promoting nuclease/putative transposase [Thermoguttaceae bacterium]